MQFQYDPFLEPAAQVPSEMKESFVPRSYELDFTDVNNLDDWHTVPNKSNFVLDYEHPRVPSFMEDFKGAPYFTPQPEEQFGMDFGYSTVEKGEYLLIDQPAQYGGHLLDTDMNMGNGYALQDSYQSIEESLDSPSSVGSSLESSPWELIGGAQDESVWDLTALNPDSCNISNGEHSKSFDWDGMSTSMTNFPGDRVLEDNMRKSAHLLQLSLVESFRYPCTFKNCTKSFKRKEHAKRHYVTKHTPRQSDLRCEFCGKDTFTRSDNLNAHRRLHARYGPKHNSGVHFVPAALEVIRSRTRSTRKGDKWVTLDA
ncbi:zinc finger odd-paired-like (opl) [Fusarium pseudoanthophilum]|uniref:Zinc finger odd-paired-like (Opl) n=1 Tax=Fusarium pseudoanthophilum TaxID=48495 RepID=A0A8H5NKV6_9HYPO|nr:zinc finger odd-paired-like (opl) [Fusarium pseudoanthophilum]